MPTVFDQITTHPEALATELARITTSCHGCIGYSTCDQKSVNCKTTAGKRCDMRHAYASKCRSGGVDNG